MYTLIQHSNTLMIRVYRISVFSIHKITAFQIKQSIMGYIKFGHSLISKIYFAAEKQLNIVCNDSHIRVKYLNVVHLSSCIIINMKIYFLEYRVFVIVTSCIHAIPRKLTLQLFTEMMFINFNKLPFKSVSMHKILSRIQK